MKPNSCRTGVFWGWIWLALILGSGPSVDAADVAYCRIVKGLLRYQTNATQFSSASMPYFFRSEILGTGYNSVYAATISPSSFGPQFQTARSNSRMLVYQRRYSSGSTFDAGIPLGYYILSFSTAHSGMTNYVLELKAGSYPEAAHVNNFDAAQAIDPTNSFTLTWDAFASGTTNDLVELQIENSASVVFATGAYPGASNALPGTATSVTIPANTLKSARGYIGHLSFKRIVSTNYSMAPGYAAFSQQTDFSMMTVGGSRPAVVSVVPSMGAVDVPANVRVAFTFDRPMRSSWGISVSGTTNSLNCAWQPDGRTFVVSGSSKWPAGSTLKWTLNYLNSFGDSYSFSDTNYTPVMPDTVGALFTVGTNLLADIPQQPSLQLKLNPAAGGSQLQLFGEAYRTYTLQSSSDLTNWVNLSTVLAATNQLQFTDPGASNQPIRVYRAIATP